MHGHRQSFCEDQFALPGDLQPILLSAKQQSHFPATIEEGFGVEDARTHPLERRKGRLRRITGQCSPIHAAQYIETQSQCKPNAHFFGDSQITFEINLKSGMPLEVLQDKERLQSLKRMLHQYSAPATEALIEH